MKYYYRALIGTCEFHWSGGDDKQARRKVYRLWRRYWKQIREVAPGSMYHAINNSDPDIFICRSPIIAGVVKVGFSTLEDFKVEEIEEFARVYGK